MANGKLPEKRNEEERRRMKEGLDEVGDNLPGYLVGVEGSDVGKVERGGGESKDNPLERDEEVRRKEMEIERDPVTLREGGEKKSK